MSVACFDINTLCSARLNEQSLLFINEVWAKKPTALNKLIHKLQGEDVAIKCNITAEHIDQAIASLYKQMELPTHILESIDHYFMAHNTTDIQEIFHLKKMHSTTSQPALTGMPEHILHLMDHLKLFTQKTPRTQFLQHVIQLMLRFYAQRVNNMTHWNAHPVHYAQHMSLYIIKKLNIPLHAPLKKLIDYLADQIFILGTTRIDGRTRAMNLSELFFIFEDMAQQAGLFKNDPSNQELVTSMNAIMLTMGVCHNKPIACYDLVALQHKKSNTSLLHMLKDYYSHTLLLEKFFQSPFFCRYFEKKSFHDVMNQHACLISFASHMLRPADHHNDQQQTLLQWITRCEQQRAMCENPEDFIAWFDKSYQEHHIEHITKTVFFSTIEHKITFSLSQVGSLVFTANKLVSMGFTPRAMTVAETGLFQPLICTEVPVVDAKNLKAMYAFFNTLLPSQQSQWIKELLIITCMQTHVIQEQHMNSPMNNIRTKTPSYAPHRFQYTNDDCTTDYMAEAVHASSMRSRPQ